MISHEITQLARTSLVLIDYAVERGMERGRLMRVAGLSAETLEDPDSRIRTASMVKLWRAVIGGLNDPILGLHVGSSTHATQLGLVGYAVFHSRNGYSALHRFARYVRILSEAVQFQIRESGDRALITWQAHPALAVLRQPVETGIALVVALGREISGPDENPMKVELPGSRPDDDAGYRDYFRCPVEFERPTASLTYSRQQLARPTLFPDETLAGYLDELANMRLNPLQDHDESMTDAVRRALWAMLPGGRPDLWRTADEIGVSVRTLQRRMGEEGTSFSKVLDTLRRDLANEMLADRGLSVSEPSAFQRAYRRWWGVSARRGVA